jgi:hypothetical protein
MNGYDIKKNIKEQGLQYKSMCKREGMDVLEKDVVSLEGQLTSKINEFKTTLQQYKDEYVKFFSKASTNQSVANVSSKYLNKIIYGPNNEDLYFVNKYGYKRKIHNGELDKNTCPSNTPIMSNVDGQPYNLFKKGTDMLSHLKCNQEENNVFYITDTKKYYWADEKGLFHEVEDWDNRDPSCPELNENSKLTQSDFQLLKPVFGAPIKKGDTCTTTRKENKTLREINILFNKLVSLSSEIMEITAQLIQVSDTHNYKHELNNIENNLKVVKNEHERLNKQHNKYNKYDDLLENTRIQYRENHTKYLMWMTGVAVIGGITLHQMLK